MAKKVIITGWRSLFTLKRRSPRDRRAFGIVGISLGIFASVLTANQLHVNQQFAGPTIKVIGSVEALYPLSRPSWLSHFNPKVAYCYPVGTSEVHTVAAVSEKVFDGFYVGEPLPVKYLPDHPAINRIDVPVENVEQQQRPYWLTAFSIFFLCGGTYMLTKACRDLKSGKNHRTARDLGYVPAPNTRKEVWVRGWSREDFSKILSDFGKFHADSLGTEIAAKTHSLKNGTLRITFPQDVPDRLFPFLINYAQYPKGFKPEVDSILVVGKAILSGNFEGNPDPKLIGQEAIFYVPSDDRKYDVVYVQVGEETFACSLGSSSWKKVMDPRLPTGFANLSSAPQIIA